jgi:hypothetical protein
MRKFGQKMCWATFWAIFPQTPPVTLLTVCIILRQSCEISQKISDGKWRITLTIVPLLKICTIEF